MNIFGWWIRLNSFKLFSISLSEGYSFYAFPLFRFTFSQLEHKAVTLTLDILDQVFEDYFLEEITIFITISNK